jgi:hypothetical protein
MIVLHPHINGLKPTDSTLSWWKFMVEQELPTLPEHLSSPPVFSGARVTRSLVFMSMEGSQSLRLRYLSQPHWNHSRRVM